MNTSLSISAEQLSAFQREQLAVAELAVRQFVDAALVELYWGDNPYGPYTPISRPEYDTVLGKLRYWGNWTNPAVWLAGDEPADPESWQAIHESL